MMVAAAMITHYYLVLLAHHPVLAAYFNFHFFSLLLFSFRTDPFLFKKKSIVLFSCIDRHFNKSPNWLVCFQIHFFHFLLHQTFFYLKFKLSSIDLVAGALILILFCFRKPWQPFNIYGTGFFSVCQKFSKKRERNTTLRSNWFQNIKIRLFWERKYPSETAICNNQRIQFNSAWKHCYCQLWKVKML